MSFERKKLLASHPATVEARTPTANSGSTDARVATLNACAVTPSAMQKSAPVHQSQKHESDACTETLSRIHHRVRPMLAIDICHKLLGLLSRAETLTGSEARPIATLESGPGNGAHCSAFEIDSPADPQSCSNEVSIVSCSYIDGRTTSSYRFSGTRQTVHTPGRHSLVAGLVTGNMVEIPLYVRLHSGACAFNVGE